MINPCQCCECGLGQGARTAASTSIVLNLGFMLHCFLSVVDVAAKHQDIQAANISTIQTLTADEGQSSYFLGIPIQIPENEIIITVAILMMSTLRLVLSVLFLLGVQKNRVNLIYPWILATIVDLVGLFSLVVVLVQIAFGEDAFNEFNKMNHVNQEEAAMEALLLIVGIIALVFFFSYFIWIAFAFISETRNNPAVPPAVNGEDNHQNESHRNNSRQRRMRRSNRVSAPPQLRPGGDGLPYYDDIYVHTFEPIPDYSPPAYEDAVKMPRPSRCHYCPISHEESTT